MGGMAGQASMWAEVVECSREMLSDSLRWPVGAMWDSDGLVPRPEVWPCHKAGMPIAA